jgi:hypothetical protein
MRQLIVAGLLALLATTASGQSVPTNFVAHLSGDQEVPLRPTDATGQAKLQLNTDGTALAYRLIVANIENVVASHIHLGPAGANGPVVAFLYGPAAPAGGRLDGVIAVGVITAADLTGPLVGQDLSVLVAALRSGGAYVNVHTNDGIAPTNEGPGDFPGGEVRGQIDLAGKP